MVPENNELSFFQLFQYCLGSGLGTNGDFFSEQLAFSRPAKSSAKRTRSGRHFSRRACLAFLSRFALAFVRLNCEFRSWLRPRAVSRLRALCAQQDYKVATLGAPPSFARNNYYLYNIGVKIPYTATCKPSHLIAPKVISPSACKQKHTSVYKSFPRRESPLPNVLKRIACFEAFFLFRLKTLSDISHSI